MRRISNTMPLALALTVSLTACGDGSAGEAQQTAVAGGSVKPACPTVAEIETTVGFPVRSHSVPVDGCLYELTGEYQGVMVSLMYQPAARAEEVFAEITRGVKGAKGANAEPDRLSVGEGGVGYTSMGRKVAAAVSKGRLYNVEISHMLFESLALPADAATRVIELGMRTAPGPGASGAATAASAGGGAAAQIDACTLASNAEVSRIAEVRADLVQYWSAPVVSFGGTHCDYDGGSIRVYQGSAAAANFESTLKAMKAEDAPKTAVSGVGDRAYFMVPFPDDPYKRLGLLAVHDGQRVVQLTLDTNGDEPIEATRPRLERLAQLVLPRLP